MTIPSIHSLLYARLSEYASADQPDPFAITERIKA
jgi:hypothetical protein